MSYSLEFDFKPAVQLARVLQYFIGRAHYEIDDAGAFYRNADTGVYFSFEFRHASRILFRRNVRGVEFELNYHRPSFFGIEAERELSTFAATFRPRIHDPQIRGMENGPYSPEGFLRGWNFGNTFGIRAGLLKKPDVSAASLPTAELNAAWAWNYHRAERSDALKDRCFVPSVDFFRIEGRTSRVALWPPGMPIWLPRVDYVLVGSTISGQKRYGLAPWRDVLDVVRRAGFDTTKDPLRLEYRVTPPAIANWVENIPCTDLDALRREYLRPDQILDRELLAAARESIDENEGEFRIVREILNPETGS